MNISNTDLKILIKLLLKGAFIIDKYSKKPSEGDVARRMRLFAKKLIKKDGEVNR